MQHKLIYDSKYLEKANIVTQDGDRRKLAVLESEANSFETTIEQFRQLKLE
jgi:valyl-tRNA synthetase